MEDVKPTIAFYTCSNGYGHFKRVIEVAGHLQQDFCIDIYCEKFQYDKFKPLLNVNFIFYKKSNIRWDLTIKKNKVDFDSYNDWIKYYGKDVEYYDYVISDNIVGLLQYRKDLILMGSFLWKDVFENKFGDNTLTKFDNKLLEKYNPTVITNKYTETDSLVHYNNKVQFGFGCPHKQRINYWDYYKTIVTVEPSLDYLSSYKECFDIIKTTCSSISELSTDITTIDECIYVIRPGVGMLTHCVEHNIPIVALYDPKDSSEIITLAKLVEKLGIGIAHNTTNKQELVDGYFIAYKLNKFLSNRIYNKVELEKEGYENSAKYLRRLML